MKQRLDATWMGHLDERILEHLDDADGPMTAWELAYDLGAPTRRRVAERCRILAEAGFAVHLDRDGFAGEYDITGDGQRYLEGEVDADHRRPVPGAKPPGKMRPLWYAGFDVVQGGKSLPSGAVRAGWYAGDR